ncbi:hypothetical protein IOQ59_15005 [Pontibacterium sp. N1Y112]|uniref:Uncharacterized protein n=1 Tax=Pontibacterium sinense TaxID=2781979 RepID=A0A8J7K050_9GAMM|nr:hypothetical protein [Pontibacterium sinense]MBE9398564.1 hypothetical protein [Pontibacterium sinense]
MWHLGLSIGRKGAEFTPFPIKLHAKEPANKSETPLAFRAVRDQGDGYSHAGCLAKTVNTEIEML